jgi:hypothetical protein
MLSRRKRRRKKSRRRKNAIAEVNPASECSLQN